MNQLNHINILLIEDDDSLRETLLEILTLEGYQVQASKHGYAALKIANEQSFDLIICSRVFSDSNSWDILQELRQKEQTIKTPFIFLSSNPLGSLHNKIGGQEAVFILIKPFLLDQLLDAVRECLSSITKD